MRASNILLTAALAIEAALGSPVQRRDGYAVKERSYLPHRWTETGPAPAAGRMVFSIALTQSNFDELERQLYEGMKAPSSNIETLSEGNGFFTHAYDDSETPYH